MMRRRHKGRAKGFLWGALLLLLGGLYLGGFFSPHPAPTLAPLPEVGDPAFTQGVAAFSSSPTATGTLTGFWVDAPAIFAAREAAIRRAQHTLRVETYFMTPGKRADAFAAAIAERARAGVRVQLLVDSQGTTELPEAYWKRLEDAHVELRFYHPFQWRDPLRYNIRTHRKLLIVDDQEVLTGGAGYSDEWDGRPEAGETGPWREVEVGLRGPVAAALTGVFMQHWGELGGTVELPASLPAPGQSSVLITPSDASPEHSQVGDLLTSGLKAARKRFWLASPYFLPSRPLREELLAARKRGVDVRILGEGPRNDKNYIYLAVRELYGDLLAGGVPVYEYAPAFSHAKVLLVDDRWVSMGSANFDPRSFFHNDELNISLASPGLASQVEGFFRDSFRHSKAISLKEWQARPLRDRLEGRSALLFRWQL